jgi:Luciferase-like monooxygenase
LISVDKFETPVLNAENALKVGIFGINLRGGVARADVEGNVQGTWEENLRLARWDDRLGLDAIVPIARWRGYGGAANLGDGSFETVTWATRLMAETERIQAFATMHVALAHPDRRDLGARARGRARDDAPRQLRVVARAGGRLGDADGEDRHARLGEHVVVVGREHDHHVRARGPQMRGHAAVQALDLRGRGRALRDPEREVGVVRDAEAADDLSHR